MRLTVSGLYELARLLDEAAWPIVRFGIRSVRGIPDDDRFIWARDNWDRARGESLTLAVWAPDDGQDDDDQEILIIDEDAVEWQGGE